MRKKGPLPLSPAAQRELLRMRAAFAARGVSAHLELFESVFFLELHMASAKAIGK